MATGLASDYTEMIKQHKIEGQNLTMWEQFLTGTQEQFKTLGKQVTSAYETGVTEARQASAYDISQAYSNYKKQQLSLQMQEQLGAGFKQELGSELKSAYDVTYSGLEKQRENALSKLQSEYVSSLTELGEDYETAVKKGESEFAKLGEQAQAFDRLIHQYAEDQENVFSDNYVNTIQGESGEIIKELSDEGKLWYYEIFNNPDFQKWFLEGDEADELTPSELKQREELYEIYRSNPDLIKQIIGGIDSDFNAEKVRANVREEKIQTARKSIDSDVANVSDTIEFAWKDSFMIFNGQPFAFDEKYYTPKTVDSLREVYERYGINPDYAEADLKTVMHQMRQYFTDTGMHQAATQKSQYQQYLKTIIEKRLQE